MIPDFAARLNAWQRAHGRHDLPWQVSDPYAIWLAEIMLQQTQVETVIPYYRHFLARFPDVASLAAAPEDDVLACWSGLGYYARARNLHAAAKVIATQHAGRFPDDVDAIQALPGIGRSTAAAIAVFSFGARQPILDGNVKRVFCRLFGVEGWPGNAAVERQLWELAESLLPEQEIATYTQGLMDLGATLCRPTRPGCVCCPFAADCVANRDSRQGELPSAKPSKLVPERETAMLVLLHGGEVLLEKRPSPGIWGGLWSLPECPPATDISKYLDGLGFDVASNTPMPVLRHAFSHFRLQIRPHVLALARRPLTAAEPCSIWLALDDLPGAALPTPVRKILRDVVAGFA